MRSGPPKGPWETLTPRGASAQPSGCPPQGLTGGGTGALRPPHFSPCPRWPSAHTACPPAGESLDAYSSHSRQRKVPERCARKDPGSPRSPGLGAGKAVQQAPSKAAEGGGALAEGGGALAKKGGGWHHLCSSSLGEAGAGCRAFPRCALHPTASHVHTPARTCTHLHTPARPTHTCTSARNYTHLHTPSHTYTHLHAPARPTHACTSARNYTHLHTPSHTYTHLHTPARTCTH